MASPLMSVRQSVRPAVRPAICPQFVCGADLGNSWGYCFHFEHVYLLGGVAVPFGVYEI